MKSLWTNLLKIPAFRRAILAHLRLDYFHELHHSIPLGNNYWAHLWENDAYDSFSEIFIQEEYADFIPDEPITKILDLGAHYGYFSLWLQSKRPKNEIYSLMVEPSQRCQRSLDKMVSIQNWEVGSNIYKLPWVTQRKNELHFLNAHLWVVLYFLTPPQIAAMK